MKYIKKIITLIFFFLVTINTNISSEENKKQKINEVLKEIGTSVDQVLGSDEIEKYKNYKIPENIKEEAEKDLKNNHAQIEKKKNFYKKEIIEKTFKHVMPEQKNNQKNEKEEEQENNFILDENEYIFVLISSSIPKKTLTNYIASIEKLNNTNIQLVLRGFIDGMKKIKPTQDFISDIVIKNPSCKNDKGQFTKECEAYASKIIIDPLIFRTFKIDKVPAIVYTKNLNLRDRDRSIGYPDNIKNEIEGFTLFGDISIDYALTRFYGETKNKKFLKLQEKLRKGFY
jgi:type-F conjugative transfer system pilin assembly protein TrbC